MRCKGLAVSLIHKQLSLWPSLTWVDSITVSVLWIRKLKLLEPGSTPTHLRLFSVSCPASGPLMGLIKSCQPPKGLFPHFIGEGVDCQMRVARIWLPVVQADGSREAH